jgi:hypothetical protein
MSMNEDRTDQRPVGGLLTDLVSQVNALFRTEISLLRSEMKDSIHSLSGALVSVAVGAALLLAAVMVLVQAVVAAMVEAGMSVWLASGIVGLVLAVIGGLLLKRGRDEMSASEMAPGRTARQVEKDVALVKETAK